MSRQSTAQPCAVIDVMREAHRPLRPRDIWELAVDRWPGLGLATVYRTLRGLRDRGLARSVELAGNNVRDEPTDRGHHHASLAVAVRPTTAGVAPAAVTSWPPRVSRSSRTT